MKQDFSLVIPAFEEEENLLSLMKEIDSMLHEHRLSCEIIFVDDGSKDRTQEIMLEIKKIYPQYEIHVYSLDGNYGLSAALDAGFKMAKQDVVVSIDADLQNDPADIPKLLSKIPEYDVVIGERAVRRDSTIKLLSSKIANSFRNFLLDENFRDTGCTLKAYKRSYLQKIKMHHGMHRFLPVLLKLEGARVLAMEVNHRPRIHGKSKYHLFNRLAGPFTDLMAVHWMKKRNLPYRILEK